MSCSYPKAVIKQLVMIWKHIRSPSLKITDGGTTSMQAPPTQQTRARSKERVSDTGRVPDQRTFMSDMGITKSIQIDYPNRSNGLE